MENMLVFKSYDRVTTYIKSYDRVTTDIKSYDRVIKIDQEIELCWMLYKIEIARWV